MIPLIENDHSGRWHMDKFEKFHLAKIAINEPTPHMGVITWLCRSSSVNESLWLAGCYLAAYSCITGEAIWKHWTWRRMCAEPEKMLPWLRENWAGIHTRVPRRCVRTPEKFARCLLSFARWIREDFPRLKSLGSMRMGWDNKNDQYDDWWESANNIDFFGRYVSIRLLELMRRWGHMDADLYDIRAVGAHSPIRCMMLLRPSSVDELATGDAEVVNRIAQDIKSRLSTEQSYFMFATLLCEYRACYEGSRDYAGNQHDEELEYSLSKYAAYWKSQGLRSRLYRARAAIDPHVCLGEIQGWSRRRRDVAGWMRERGVVWSDITHDYLRSIEADRPVRRK